MKTIKHENMLQPRPEREAEGYSYFQFICRGCTMRNREDTWNGFLSSIAAEYNREKDNSYLSLEEEPSNTNDPNAVMVVCRGEHFGTVGYVGKEYTKAVKEILSKASEYRVDMLLEQVNREVDLVLTWR